MSNKTFAPVIARPIPVFSKDRLAGSISAQNFNVDLSVPSRHERHSKLILNHIIIPHTFKNICEHTDQIVITEDVDAANDPMTYTFSLTNLNLSANDLATQLASELTTKSAASGQSITYAVTFDRNSNKFTFSTATAGKTFQFLWTNSASTMARILGFSTSADSDVVADVAGTPSGSVASISSDLAPLVQGVTTIELHVNKFSDGNNSEQANRTSDIMLSIPITSVFSENLVFKPNLEQYQFDVQNFHGVVNFRLSCNYNNGLGRVDLPSDSDWSMFFIDVESQVADQYLTVKRPAPGQSSGFVIS